MEDNLFNNNDHVNKNPFHMQSMLSFIQQKPLFDYCLHIILDGAIQAWIEKKTDITIQASSLVKPTTLGSVMCDDEYECPDHFTCCRMASGRWGCCPYEDVCVINSIHNKMICKLINSTIHVHVSLNPSILSICRRSAALMVYTAALEVQDVTQHHSDV